MLQKRKPNMATEWLYNWTPGLIVGAQLIANRARVDGGGPEAPGEYFENVISNV
jgi:hypothetical protein